MFVLVFIVILGALVFFHELGHFVTARRNGINASEFGLGFPPRLFGFQKLKGKKDGKRFEKWRIIWGGRDGDDEGEKKDLKEAHADSLQGGTIYSINWIPIGGFVKIKGEDGSQEKDPDSFAAKGAWVRIKVLLAGVAMNFILAWVLISIGYMIGAPELVDNPDNIYPDSKIQITNVVPDSPATQMGLAAGDEVLKTQINPGGTSIKLNNVSDLQKYINSEKGQRITLKVKRGSEVLSLSGTPRENAPAGQGSLGVELGETVIVKYPWYQAVWKGATYVFGMTMMILGALGGLLKNLFMGHSVAADLSGPVKIAVYTKQVTEMGLIYVINLAAILSINLGIINALPFPALDGGRTLFVIIEKIKGSPVNKKIEQMAHTIGFAVLLLLMVLVTFRDILGLIKK